MSTFSREEGISKIRENDSLNKIYFLKSDVKACIGGGNGVTWKHVTFYQLGIKCKVLDINRC